MFVGQKGRERLAGKGGSVFVAGSELIAISMPKHAKFTHFQFEMKLVIKRIKMAPRDIKLVDQFFQKA